MMEELICPYCFQAFLSELNLRQHLEKCSVKISMEDCPLVSQSQLDTMTMKSSRMPISMVVDQENVAATLRLSTHNASINCAPNMLQAHPSIKTMTLNACSDTSHAEYDDQFDTNNNDNPEFNTTSSDGEDSVTDKSNFIDVKLKTLHKNTRP